MGGRGMVSMSGGEYIHIGAIGGKTRSEIKNVGGSVDGRKDILDAFREVGFGQVEGLENVPTAVLGAYAIALGKLEEKYHSVSTIKGIDGRELPVKGMDSATAMAAVTYDRTGVPTALLVNRASMSSISNMNDFIRKDIARGWIMPTDGTVKSLARYIVTHEYGHIMESALWKTSTTNQKEGVDARSRATKILKLAQKKYGATKKDVSSYGLTDSYEFFAEAFANANSGKPNAVGMAMTDYLRTL